MTVMVRYLDHENSEVQTIVAQGFAKLLLLNHIATPQVLSHLMILYFNPTTEENIRRVTVRGVDSKTMVKFLHIFKINLK